MKPDDRGKSLGGRPTAQIPDRSLRVWKRGYWKRFGSSFMISNMVFQVAANQVKSAQSNLLPRWIKALTR